MMKPHCNSMRKPAVFALLIFLGPLLFWGVAGGANGPVGGDDVRSAALLLAIFVLLALAISFICSLTEAALLSITPSYIVSLKEKKPQRAILLKTLRQDDVDKSLAAILTLNTVAHTVGAIVAGAQALIVFGSAWISVFSAVMTLLILFLSEIIPKTLGAVHWRRLAGLTALFVKYLIIVLYPFVRISQKLTVIIAKEKKTHIFSREEFIAMARICEQSGHIRKQESRIIRSLFRFGAIGITNIMTPRTVIMAFQEDTTISEALGGKVPIPFSRLPVYGKDIDDITGFVLMDEMLSRQAQGQGHLSLASLKRHVRAVPDSLSLSTLLEILLEERRHIVIVVDEYGGTSGLVTLEDVMETLLGIEITDEMDNVEDMQALARQQWEKRARALGLDPDR